jgi:hypothetical protein
MEYVQCGSSCVSGEKMSGSVTVAGEGAGATDSMAVADAATGAGALWGCAIGAFIVAARDAEREYFFVTVIVSGLDVMGSSDRLAVSGQRGAVAGSGMVADVMDAGGRLKDSQMGHSDFQFT